MRASDPGWNLVAMHDPADRRGIWIRHDAGKEAIEICAGREGDDYYVNLSIGQKITPQQILALNNIMLLGMWAIDLAVEDGDKVSETWIKRE